MAEKPQKGASVKPQCTRGTRRKRKKVGIALGGGGAKGLAHVLMLEVMDELGVRPSVIAGTSIGAVIRVLYASGLSARDIREGIDEFTLPEGEFLTHIFSRRELFKWISFIDPEIRGGWLLNADKFLSFLYETIQVDTFEKLKIPLKVVAADFWNRKEVIFEAGQILPAIQASMAIPGLFKPLELDDQVMVDGGVVNPVPYDLLEDRCDITVAVDVMGRRSEGKSRIPGMLDAMFNTFQIMQRAIMAQKMRIQPPTIYVEPTILDIRVLDFHKAKQIFQQAESAKNEFRRQLEAALTG